jgi:hypothetical protein
MGGSLIPLPKPAAAPLITQLAQAHPAGGALARSARAGTNHISFQGPFSPTGTLKPGRYTVVATATNAAGQHSLPKALTFTIVK